MNAGRSQASHPGREPAWADGCWDMCLTSDPGSQGRTLCPWTKAAWWRASTLFVRKGSLYLRFCIYTWYKCTYVEMLSVQTLTTPQVTHGGHLAGLDGPEKGSHSGLSSQ